MLALLAAIENIVPPVPADTAVALGAFLSHRGVISLPIVYAVTLAANIAGATLVYVAARRYGRPLFASRTARRLLSPAALAVVEREYLRFGWLGLFFGRFLPGIRAVVPPFAGLADLGPVRALLPITLASAIWYGAVALIGAAIGAEWTQIRAILGGVNRTLGVIALVVVAGAAIVIWRRRRRDARLWTVLRRLLLGLDTESGLLVGGPRAAAVGLLEVAWADPSLSPDERARITADLRQRWGLKARASSPRGPDSWDAIRHRLQEQFGHARRCALVERLAEVVFNAGRNEPMDTRLVERAGLLLGLEPGEIAELARRAQGDAQ